MVAQIRVNIAQVMAIFKAELKQNFLMKMDPSDGET